MGGELSYDVREGQIRKGHNNGWCGTRLLVNIVVIASTIIYVIGSIITGIAYYHYEFLTNCTANGWFIPTETYVYQTPLVVVGPCFMSAGGSILVLFLFQWCFCRPSFRD